MNFYPERDQKTFIEHSGHRITKSYMRIGTRERTVYRVWKRGDGVWSPVEGVFESADAAKQHIGENNE